MIHFVFFLSLYYYYFIIITTTVNFIFFLLFIYFWIMTCFEMFSLVNEWHIAFGCCARVWPHRLNQLILPAQAPPPPRATRVCAANLLPPPQPYLPLLFTTGSLMEKIAAICKKAAKANAGCPGNKEVIFLGADGNQCSAPSSRVLLKIR